MDAMIYCKDGQCKFVNPTELLLNQSEEELGGINQVQLKWIVSTELDVDNNVYSGNRNTGPSKSGFIWKTDSIMSGTQMVLSLPIHLAMQMTPKFWSGIRTTWIPTVGTWEISCLITSSDKDLFINAEFEKGKLLVKLSGLVKPVTKRVTGC